MPKTRPPYPPQFRARLIELARTGRTPEELGRQFEPSAQTIRNWLRQADRDDGRRTDGLTTEERDEVRRLRRENKTLREEREILKKAAAWFAAMLRPVYHLLAEGTTHGEPGPEYSDRPHAHRVTRRAIQLLERQGYRVVLDPAA
jgi:transposase